MFTYSIALVERVRAELTVVRADRKGVTALEYGLLAGLIAVVIVVGAGTLGTAINAQFVTLAGLI
jgi:pilus assembly protein Flp/PilA